MFDMPENYAASLIAASIFWIFPIDTARACGLAFSTVLVAGEIMQNRCPCCGGNLEPQTFWDKPRRIVSTPLGQVDLSGCWLQADIFDLLWRQVPNLTMDRILNLAYAHVKNSATSSTIYMTMRRLKVHVAVIGIEIVSGRKGGDGYHLVLPQAQRQTTSIIATQIKSVQTKSVIEEISAR
jgi:hypothetical protein